MKMVFPILFFLLLALPCATLLGDETENPSRNWLSAKPVDSSLKTTENKPAETEEDFIYPLRSERRELLISYSKFKNVWRFVSFVLKVVILVVLLYSGLSGWFLKKSREISQKQIVQYLLYFLFFTLFIYLVNLPLDYYRGFYIEHQYGFSNQNFVEWFGEGLKSELIGFIFGFLLVLTLYWLINRFKKWWLYFSLGSLPVLILVVLIFPVLISPLFNNYEPVKDKYLADEMIALAERAEIHEPDVLQVDASRQTKKLNAYFTGMFGTRRIVLYDNIISAMSVDELKFVMGHEIGHYKMDHLLKGLFISIFFIFVALFLMNKLLPGIISRNSRRFRFSKLGEIGSLPLIILFISIFSFVTQPVQNGISRAYEYRADEFGLKLSEIDAKKAAVVFDKLSVYNLADPDPPAIIEFWFYSHPSVSKRIKHIHEIYAQIKRGENL